MSEPRIGPRSVVRLHSGGPDMTVRRVGRHNGEPSAWCVWFENKKCLTQPFALHVLEPVKAGGEGAGSVSRDGGRDEPSAGAGRKGPVPIHRIEWVIVRPGDVKRGEARGET